MDHRLVGVERTRRHPAATETEDSREGRKAHAKIAKTRRIGRIAGAPARSASNPHPNISSKLEALVPRRTLRVLRVNFAIFARNDGVGAVPPQAVKQLRAGTWPVYFSRGR